MMKFWSNASGTYKIDSEALHKFLMENGFHTLVTYGKDKILVQEKEKVISQVSKEDIREHCWTYINKQYEFENPDERKQVIDLFYRNRSLLSRDNLLLLDEIDLNTVKDDDVNSYFFFNNCILKINQIGYYKLQFGEIDGNLWKNDIIDFNLNCEIPDEITPEGEFYEFFLDITKHSNEQVQEQNRISLRTIIGYLLHRYKDPANAKAVILMDPYKDGNPQGGTGKGLFSKAIGKIRHTAFQSGKSFAYNDKFAFSNVNYRTRILTFDDVPKDFDFEKIFSLITEKAVIERKYENKFDIPYEESPKVVITTNYTVEGKGSSHRRRKIEFILSDTYDDNYSPEDRFEHLLFNHWDNSEWERFYLFMADCVQLFLMIGIVEPKFNIGERTLKINASQSFIDFINTEIDLGVKYNKKEVFEEFKTKFPDHPTIEQNTFTKWIKLYADAYSFTMTESHSGEVNYFELTF